MPTPVKTPRSASSSAIDELFAIGARWRTELLLVLALVGPSVVVALKVSRVLALVLGVGTISAVIGVPKLRRAIGHGLYVAHHRRRFEVVASHLRGSTLTERRPLVRHAKRTLAGARLTLTLRPGTHAGDLEQAVPALASSLRAREVRVIRDASDASIVHLHVITRDPFAAHAFAWPGTSAVVGDAWSSIPVGVDEDGAVVALALAEHHVLLGGETGAGKSGALSLIVAAVALDPHSELWLLDAKLVELAPWRGCARRFCGPEIAEAINVLDELRGEMTARYERLLTMRKRKVERGDGFVLQVVVIDELASYLGHPEKKLSARFADSLRDLLARGRAAGIVVVAATQKPSTDLVPSAIRDLFAYRWAMRCSTRDASDTVLGAGWASNGYSAAQIDPATRGVGLLLQEGGVPLRLRTYWLDDDTIDAVAATAQSLRRAPAPERVHHTSGPFSA
jgi:hypothetical protein